MSRGVKQFVIYKRRNMALRWILTLELALVILIMWGVVVFVRPMFTKQGEISLHAASPDQTVANDDYAEDVSKLRKLKVAIDDGDMGFRTNDYYTRAEFVRIVVQAKNVSPHPLVNSNCFADVKTEWFAPYVCYAKRSGWISGRTAKTFDTDSIVNYAEAFSIVSKVFKVGLKQPEDPQKKITRGEAVHLIAQFLF